MTNVQQTAARQKASAIRRNQAEILNCIPTNTLHIALYIRSDPPVSNDFHWAFYDHSTRDKYHIRGINDSWIPAHESVANILSDNYLCVLIEIATLGSDVHERMDQIMKSFDSTLNLVSGITCRTWLMMVLHMLVGSGLVNLDVEEVERECYDFGNGFSLAASLNVQPRPVVKSMFALME
jgi:hypothetical protein